MGMIRGQKEYLKFKKGGKLTRAEAMKAMCYSCNGLEESREDCQGYGCPMYQYRLYRGLETLEVGKNPILRLKKRGV